ncbi:MAG: FAD-dependent oxidoreductase [Planctomycetota bacterium]
MKVIPMGMAEHIEEPARRVRVLGNYDVVVVGGGIAGVAAAVSAERAGAHTCLIEKENAPGGLATLGLVAIFLPLCDGRGHQLMAGMAEELLELSIRYGPGELPECWRPGGNPAHRRRRRYSTVFNPASFLLALEELLENEGVELLYDSRFCALKTKDDGQVEAVVVENKSGRLAIRCDAVVDATGDADVAHCAGEDTVSLDTNPRSAWYYSFDGSDIQLHKRHDQLYSNGAGEGMTFAADNCHDVTRMSVESRKMIPRDSGGDEYPVVVPVIPQFRMSRRLKGPFELDEVEGESFPDAVGWTGDWRRSGPTYCLPLRCLMGQRTGNLLMAGRCVSVTNSMWDIIRAIPTCAVTGQAAGAGSALLSDEGGSVMDMEVGELQALLREQGAIVDRPISGKKGNL